MGYIPKLATIQQACDWLAEKTSSTWVLARLLESGLTPWFWVDYSPTAPEKVFCGRIEGYLAPMIFTGDLQRLEADGAEALVNITRNAEGVPMKVEPGMRVPLAELRFKREDIEALAAEPADGTPSTVPAGAMRWTPEFIEEVRAYRASHTAAATAVHYGVSATLIRKKLAVQAPAPSINSAFNWKNR